MNNIEKVPVEISVLTENGIFAEQAIACTCTDNIADEKKHDSNIKCKIHGHEEKSKKFEVRPINQALDPNGPKDKYYVVMIMFLILGIIHILPYTFFTTANEYWMYKFRNATSNSTDANDRTYLQANFSSLSYFISSGPSTIAQFLLVFLGHKIRAKTRIMSTLALHSLVFVLQTVFVVINTDDWQVPFFVITVCCLTLISCSMCLGSTGNMVTVSQFPDPYLKAYLVGEGVAALFTSVMRLISIISAPTTTAAALLYFVTGSVIMTASTILFYLSTHLKFFRHYTKNLKTATRKPIPRLPEFKEVLKYTWPILLLQTIFFLVPHNAVQNLVVSEYYGTDSVWGSKYFVTCTTYLLTAICGILGRSVFNKFEINPSIRVLSLLIITRELIFTPLMFFINAKPRKHLPVLFPHDWQYAVIVGTQYFTAGYTSSMLTMKTVRIVPPEKLELAWLIFLLVLKVIFLTTSPLGLLIVSLL